MIIAYPAGLHKIAKRIEGRCVEVLNIMSQLKFFKMNLSDRFYEDGPHFLVVWVDFRLCAEFFFSARTSIEVFST